MSLRNPAVAIVLVVLFSASFADDPKPAIDLALAEQFFQEAERLWKLDAGKLWGRALDGPLLFVDRATRHAVANRADAEGQLRPAGAVFAGRLPDTVTVANTTTKWAGVDWIMVLWPLPRSEADRRVLLMHESWHRVQRDLGLPPTGPANAHLDTLDGRTTLQLEWRALAEALQQRGDPRRTAIENALQFRAERRRKFKEAATDERLLEMHEGLAEYTGVKLSGLDEAEQRRYVAAKLEQRPAQMPTFVRSFAYLSGPAYGLLLDAASPGWQTKAKSGDDLGELLRTALALKLPESESGNFAARARPYDGDKLRDQEEKRDRERQKRIADLRARFVDAPVLTIPLQKMQISFDPNASQPLEGVGTVYMAARIGDKWGALTAPRGVLISADFAKATVPAPSDSKTRPIKGDGWELQLADGWRLDAGQRKGDWQVVSAATPRITATEADREIVASLQPHLDAGKKRVEQFFDRPFPKTFDVEVLPSRSSFDEYFQRRWKIPKTEAWMVASGVADRMVILSPRVWNTEAREHNPADTDHIRDLIAHELVHVYHGQFSPKPDFDCMDDMGWFVEGLAVFASGQLEHSHRSAAAAALKEGKAPSRLADAWSGRYRYGVSGSIVEFVDKRYGRDVIRKLLTTVTNDEAFKILNTTESQILENWKADVTTRK